MAGNLWKKIDAVEDFPVYLRRDQDECFYARDYISHGGYTASEANSLISNLKKAPSTRGTLQWKHKIRAAHKFASEIVSVLPDGATITFIPTSKTPDDPEYDPRFDMVAENLRDLNPTIRVDTPIGRQRSVPAAHRSWETRKIECVYQSLAWQGFVIVPKFVVLVDDVITCGTSFRACKQLILEHHETMMVYGLFWAKTCHTPE